jgi:hypothetical protein
MQQATGNMYSKKTSWPWPADPPFMASKDNLLILKKGAHARSVSLLLQGLATPGIPTNPVPICTLNL